MNTIQYNVATHFVSALINGDTSGFNQDDIDALDRFEQQERPRGHWAYSDDAPAFRRCDICHLLADTVLLEWVIMR